MRAQVARPARKNLLLAARICAGGLDAPVRIRNMSAGGAMLDGPALPDVGATVTLLRMELAIEATVMWKDDGRCGVALSGTVVIDDWIGGAEAPGQQFGQMRVDAIQAAVRSGSVLATEPPPFGAPIGGERRIDGRIAAELETVKRLLDAVGDEITDDPDVLSRFSGALQNFDIACQIIAHLGAVVAATDRAGAIACLPMHDLRNRLSGRPALQ